MSLGNKADFPRFLGSSPLRLGLTWALSVAGQPVPRLQEVVVVLKISKQLKKEQSKSIFFISTECL